MYKYKTINNIKINFLSKYKKDFDFVKKYSLHMINNNSDINIYKISYYKKIIDKSSFYDIKQIIQSEFHSYNNIFNNNIISYKYVNSYFENILSAYILLDYYDKELIYIDNFNIKYILQDIIHKLKIISQLDIDNIININTNKFVGFYSLDKYINYIIFEMLKNSIKAIKVKLHNDNFKPIIILNISEDENNIIINIFDNGIGIKDIDKILLYTYTTSNKNNIFLSGYGLGLSFSKFFIEFLNGNIHIDSVYNYYTSIKIIIPK